MGCWVLFEAPAFLLRQWVAAAGCITASSCFNPSLVVHRLCVWGPGRWGLAGGGRAVEGREAARSLGLATFPVWLD